MARQGNLIYKVANFLGGLWYKLTDKNIVKDTNVVQISNFNISGMGDLTKRAGRELIVAMGGTGTGSGLIQNKLAHGTSQLLAWQNGTLNFMDSSLAVNPIFAGANMAQMYAQYWQNQCFFGNGVNELFHFQPQTAYKCVYIADYASMVNNPNVKVARWKTDEYIYDTQFLSYGVSTGMAVHITDMCMDMDKIYILDNSNHKIIIIWRYDNSLIGEVNLYQTGSGNGYFVSECAIAVDSNYIYVVDQGNKRVQLLTKAVCNSATSAVPMASPAAYNSKFSTDSSYTPYSIAVYGDNIYVACKTGGIARIQIFNRETLSYSTFIGFSLSGNFVNFIVRISAPDSSGISYIFLLQNTMVPCLQLFSLTGTLIRTITALGGGTPSGLDVSINRIYISTTSIDSHILVYDFSGNSKASFGSKGSGNNQFIAPACICVDPYDSVSLDYDIRNFNSPYKPYVIPAGVGNIGTGTYYYKIAFMQADGSLESCSSPASNPVVTPGSTSNLLRLYDDTINNTVTNWCIYRSNDGTNFHRIELITFNVVNILTPPPCGDTYTNNTATYTVVLTGNFVYDGTHYTCTLHCIRTSGSSYPDALTNGWLVRTSGSGDSPINYTSYYRGVDINTKEFIDTVNDSYITSNQQPWTNPYMNSSIFCMHENRLWIAVEQKLWFSDALKPWSIAAENFLIPNSKDSLTGLYSLNGSLFCFTENDIFVLTGTSINDFNMVHVIDSIGTVAQKSIASYSQAVVFLDKDGVYMTNGQIPAKISQLVLDDFISKIQWDKTQYICSVVYENTYYLSIPTDANKNYSNQILVYDFLKQCWTIYDGWNIQDFCIYEKTDGTLSLYGVDNNGVIFELEEGLIDYDGTGTAQNIACSLETKTYDMGAVQNRKKVLFYHLSLGNDGVNPLTVTVNTLTGNNAYDTQMVKVTMGRQIIRVRPSSGYGNVTSLKLSESSQFFFQVQGFEIEHNILSIKGYTQ